MTPERLRLRAAGREAADVLAEEAASLSADALVIGVPRHRSARWTVLTPGPVLRSSAVPVLCVPEGQATARPQPKQVRSVLIATDLSEASNQVVESCVRSPACRLGDAPSSAPSTPSERPM